MTFRSQYWSCSKLANAIRGTAKPNSGTSEEWNAWTKTAKTTHSFRYWVAEELLDGIQNFLNWPKDTLYNLTYWFNNRFIEKTHVCRTGLKKGDWHETDSRIMHGMFNELVWFVNEQKSWMEYISHSKAYKDLPFYKTAWPFRHFTNFNYPKLGLAYLTWEKSLVQDESWFGYEKGKMPEEEKAKYPDFGKITLQAKNASEIVELYNWWTIVRPNRPDPYDMGGWSAYCKSVRGEDFEIFPEAKTDEHKKQCHAALDATHKIEDQYDTEDEEMMVRLIKIRSSLWT